MKKSAIEFAWLGVALLGLCWSADAAAQVGGTETPAQGVAGSAPALAMAPDPTSPAQQEVFAVHAQSTLVYQGQSGVHAPYSGTNSLPSDANGNETWDLTAYVGLRPWKGAELWANPEIDQGFGLGNTLGIAGFTSGEAYKIGQAEPYLRLQRVFFRQTIDLPGTAEGVGADLNQLAGDRSTNRLIFTIGKFSVGDVFDTNTYAHDPRADFLNWSIMEAGNLDYAADSWGYTAGSTLEWRQGRWTLRGGSFLMSSQPNSPDIDTHFSQFQLMGEIEERHEILGQPGTAKLTGFVTRGRMGRYEDAIALAEQTGQPANTADVRRYTSRTGFSINLQQQVAPDVGVFARAGASNGAVETFDFTDIDRSASGGASLDGKRWGRPNDTIGVAGVINQASRDLMSYLDKGGLGLLVGDGRLPHPGTERILESYYDVGFGRWGHVALDYQWVVNPAYNRDRGPISVLAVRLHSQI